MITGVLRSKRQRRAWLVLGLLASLTAVLHSQQPGDAAMQRKDPLTSLTQRFEQNYDLTGGDIKKLNDSYTAALQRLFDEQSKAGDLAGTIEVRKEMEAFGPGDSFAKDKFGIRKTALVPLQRLRTTYLAERHRLEVERVKRLQPTVESYRKQLAELEVELTRAGAIDLALKARGTREALEKDARFYGDGRDNERPGEEKSFAGRLIFLGKGEYEIRINGERISYRNAAKRSEQYIEFSSSPRSFRVGDVITIRMRSPFAFRSFIASIEGEDGTLMAPFRRGDYRVIGEEEDLDGLQPKQILKLRETAERGSADSSQGPAWQERDLDPVTRQRSEWVSIGSGAEWFICAVVLTDEMLVPVKKEN